MIQENRQEKMRGNLEILDKQYGVKMSFIAKEAGMYSQNLHNFIKGQQVFGEARLTRLEKVMKTKYQKILMEGVTIEGIHK